mmetsp:Transcript_62612/g.149358  ORF Transcript_62612/g.149358 Transcript_62612/m.149358 type:complete len:94 (-) Transcript_62612:1315-1596(-)
MNKLILSTRYQAMLPGSCGLPRQCANSQRVSREAEDCADVSMNIDDLLIAALASDHTGFQMLDLLCQFTYFLEISLTCMYKLNGNVSSCFQVG